MDTHSIMTILVMVILVAFSAFFSASETAFSTFNRARMRTLADDGNKRAEMVCRFAERYDTLLSTILVGNNIVNITLASVATVFFVSLIGSNGATLSTVVTTVIVLIFGEITPKLLAKQSAEKLALAIAPVLRLLMILFTPVNFLFGLWQKLIVKVFRVEQGQAITEDELLTIVEEAEQDGGINGQESELIRSAIEFNDLEAIDIYTPRVDITAVPVDAEDEEIKVLFRDTGYSRLPVYDGSIDNIIGILHQKDFYDMVYGGTGTLREVMKPPVFVPRSSKLSYLLRLLQKNQTHMAVIADEYGGTVGIVTMEDILEELVGEIYDEHDEIVEEFTKISENVYHVNGTADLDKLFKLFSLEEDEDILDTTATVGGWVIDHFEHIPTAGETFTYENLRITVLRADVKRVYEVEVEQLETEEDGEKDKEKKDRDRDRENHERGSRETE